MIRVAVVTMSLLLGGAVAASPEPDSALFELGGLPAGTQSLMLPQSERYEVRVKYGRALEPESFQATLNGEDVSARFRPAPGAAETVELPLRDGRNVLRLTGEGVSKGAATGNAAYEILVSEKAVASGPIEFTPAEQARLDDLRRRAEREGMGLEQRSKLFLKEMRDRGQRQRNDQAD